MRIVGSGLCLACQRDRYAKRRRVYSSKRWKEYLRPQVLSEEPVCQLCGSPWVRQVDHKIDIEDRPDLAYERSNLQAICDVCHGRKTRSED